MIAKEVVEAANRRRWRKPWCGGAFWRRASQPSWNVGFADTSRLEIATRAPRPQARALMRNSCHQAEMLAACQMHRRALAKAIAECRPRLGPELEANRETLARRAPDNRLGG